jgi:L-2-hydroxyglutarate oxidase
MSSATCDLVLIGGGIVGASTALQLKQRFPARSILLLDKEPRCARHQTGHNSGVVHAGVYYKPGSLKADFCKRGAALTRAFCSENNIAFRQCGKLLVATDETELQRMEGLAERCAENGIETERLSAAELQRREPNISGNGALFVPATAITDFPRITETMLAHFQDLGGVVQFGFTVRQIEERVHSITLSDGGRSVETAHLIVCGGLMADRLARMMDIDLDFQIVPFRGEYYQLPPALNDIVGHLIYPIPDPELPFLGVHLTLMIDGSVTVGPNAVLGWKREGYGRINISPADMFEMFSFPGFWRVLGANLGTGFKEMVDSLYRPGYLKRVRKYCPQITLSQMRPYPAGIRAQAVMADGSLVHDFLFSETARSLHVCNAPSPAATSALPIGEYLAGMATEKFGL